MNLEIIHFDKNRTSKRLKINDKYNNIINFGKFTKQKCKLFWGHRHLYYAKFGDDYPRNPEVYEFLDNLEIWYNPYEFHQHPEEYQL